MTVSNWKIIFIMKSDFIKIFLDKHNEFKVDITISIPHLSSGLFNTVAKIDTGCAYSSIPIKRLGFDNEDCFNFKIKDCSNNDVKKCTSFGVNDSESKRREDSARIRNADYLGLNSVSFVHSYSNLILNDCIIGDGDVRLNYDRVGNILIGMDILKQLDFHIGRDNQTGKTLLLACPLDNINDSYINEMRYCFDYIRRYQKFIY